MDGLNPEGLAEHLTGNSEINECLSSPQHLALETPPSAVGLFSCWAAPVHPAAPIHFLPSPGMVAVLSSF